MVKIQWMSSAWHNKCKPVLEDIPASVSSYLGVSVRSRSWNVLLKRSAWPFPWGWYGLVLLLTIP